MTDSCAFTACARRTVKYPGLTYGVSSVSSAIFAARLPTTGYERSQIKKMPLCVDCGVELTRAVCSTYQPLGENGQPLFTILCPACFIFRQRPQLKKVLLLYYVSHCAHKLHAAPQVVGLAPLIDKLLNSHQSLVPLEHVVEIVAGACAQCVYSVGHKRSVFFFTFLAQKSECVP
jgi:hypothetical protein